MRQAADGKARFRALVAVAAAMARDRLRAWCDATPSRQVAVRARRLATAPEGVNVDAGAAGVAAVAMVAAQIASRAAKLRRPCPWVAISPPRPRGLVLTMGPLPRAAAYFPAAALAPQAPARPPVTTPQGAAAADDGAADAVAAVVAVVVAAVLQAITAAPATPAAATRHSWPQRTQKSHARWGAWLTNR